MKVDIAKVLVDNVTKEEIINLIDEYIQSGKPHYVVTTYSEFIVFANRDQKYLEVLNKADLSIPDGIGILWAAWYLSLRSTNMLQSLWQYVWTGASLVFRPEWTKVVLPEKISGSKLIWDIAKLAAQKKYSIAMIGGTDSVATKASQKLKEHFPQLQVKLAVSDEPFDEQLVQEIANSNSDILCIAYAPPKQEKWIAQNLSQLNVKVAIGLGGTFDYLAGKRKYAPSWVIKLGSEWFWRLITQPWRIKRIWNAFAVFSLIILKYKLHGKS